MKRILPLHRINNVLLGLIILTNCYVIVAPFYPALAFRYQQSFRSSTVHKLQQKLIATDGTPRIPDSPMPQHQPNQLIIPSIFLDQTINEGHETYVELAKGVWRWPAGSTPPQGGNTIFIGHRFTYTSPEGVFYELNQLRIGNQIGVIWNNTTYYYTVTTINQVSPEDTDILTQTSQSEITLYTCTPLFVPKYRLVIVADLEHAK